MAVKASNSITVYDQTDVLKVTTFYQRLSSTANPPSAPTTPTTAATVSGWSTTMPAYGSSYRCYKVERSERGDGSCVWGAVTEDQNWAGANSANSTATDASATANAAKDAVDGLEIGGRNLLLGTNSGKDYWQSMTGNGTYQYPQTVDGIGVRYTISVAATNWCVIAFSGSDSCALARDVLSSTGEKFTLSFDFRASVVPTDYATFKFCRTDNTNNQITFGNFKPTQANVWEHFELTGTTLGVAASTQYPYINYKYAAGTYDIKNLKLERGNRATDWTPAPEDYANKGEYAVCSTAAATAAKTATCDNFRLYKGSTVHVQFSNGNTAASPTLDVNSTGAKSIRAFDGSALAVSEYKVDALAVMTLVFDGTYWRLMDDGVIKRITNAEAWLDQQAGSIALMATKEYVDAIDATVDDIVNRFEKTISSEGTAPVTALDAYTGPLARIIIDGHSIQSGTPTPSAPAAIKSVASGDLRRAGNLLKIDTTSIGDYNCTHSITGGSLSITKTNADNWAYTRLWCGTADQDTVTLSFDCTDAAWRVEIKMYDANGNEIGSTSLNSPNKSITLHANSMSTARYTFCVGDGPTGASSTTYRNVMINVGSTALPYEAYANPATLNLFTIPALSEPLRSLPDGTHDTLTVNMDGSGTVTRRVGYVDKGNAGYIGYSSTNGPYFNPSDDKMGKLQNYSASLSTMFTWANVAPASLADNQFAYRVPTSGTNVAFYMKINGVTSSSLFNTWLQSNNPAFIYPLATPTTETVPAAVLASIPAQYFTSWLEAKDENGDPIATSWSANYHTTGYDGSTQQSVDTATAELRVTADGINATVSKISSAKYLTASAASWTLANIKTYCAEGHSESWNVTSTANVRVGDTVYIKGTDSTRNCTIYCKGTVTSVNSATQVTMTMHGYEDTLPVNTAISTINQSAETVKIQASRVEIDGTAVFGAISDSVNSAIDTKVDSIEVGGRNLLLGTNMGASWWSEMNGNGSYSKSTIDTIGVRYTVTRQATDWCVIMFKGSDDFVSARDVLSSTDESFTLSFDFRASTAVDPFTVGSRKGNGLGSQILFGTVTSTITGEWEHFELTNKTLGVSPDSQYIYINHKFPVGTYDFKNLKLERGTVATDWTQAPEDMQISSRNLLLGTGSAISIGATTSTDVNLSAWARSNISANDELMISFDVNAAGATWIDCYWRSSSTSYTYAQYFYPAWQLVSGTQHVEAVGLAGIALTDISYLRIRTNSSSHGSSSGGTAATITNLMLVRANKSTDWTPAPEDVDADIATASTKATSFITEISGGGIQVHPSGNTSDRVNIDSNGMEVYDGGTSIAKFGPTARIGAAAGQHVIVDSDSFDVMNGSTTLASFGEKVKFCNELIEISGTASNIENTITLLSEKFKRDSSNNEIVDSVYDHPTGRFYMSTWAQQGGGSMATSRMRSRADANSPNASFEAMSSNSAMGNLSRTSMEIVDGSNSTLGRVMVEYNATTGKSTTSISADNYIVANGDDFADAIGALPTTGGTITGDTDIKSTNITDGTTPGSNTRGKLLYWTDSASNVIGYMQPYYRTTGVQGMHFYARRSVSGSDVNHGIQLEIDSNGNRSVTVSDQAAWRTGLGITPANIGAAKAGVTKSNATSQISMASGYTLSSIHTSIANGTVLTVSITFKNTNAMNSGTEYTIGTLATGLAPYGTTFRARSGYDRDEACILTSRAVTYRPRRSVNSNTTLYISATYVLDV